MLPEGFLTRMEGQLGPEYPAFLASLERPRAVALRLHPRKRPDAKVPFLGQRVPWEPLGYYYDPQERPGLHPYHDAGVYYLQEASAMAPVALLDPRPGERILDLCAAPGGKATQIAGRMAGRGLLVANEIQPKRAAILSQNIERMGVANALVTNETPQRLARRFPGYFHRVLVDAPCSGEGMFRKEAAAVTDWSLETVALCAQRQREILEQAAEMVRPGGRLVYSTCTFSVEEDEDVAAWFLATHPDFAPAEIRAPWFTPGPPGTCRLWPHKLLGEGHFAAVFTRDGVPEDPPAPAGGPPPREWTPFAQETGISLPPGKAVRFGRTLFWAPPETPDIAGLKIARPGLELGQALPGRFLPAHALALWQPEGARTLSLPAGSAEAAAYLHGDVLPSPDRGWVLVAVDGAGLGWAKGDGTWLKNHYPKGLRR